MPRFLTERLSISSGTGVELPRHQSSVRADAKKAHIPAIHDQDARSLIHHPRQVVAAETLEIRYEDGEVRAGGAGPQIIAIAPSVLAGHRL
jgi:hypothetical protein